MIMFLVSDSRLLIRIAQSDYSKKLKLSWIDISIVLKLLLKFVSSVKQVWVRKCYFTLKNVANIFRGFQTFSD